MTAKGYVLLSGGIDSTTCIYLANEQFYGRAVGLSVNYGQRHRKEVDYARATCAKLGVPHQELDLSSIVPKTMLTDPDSEIPDISYDEIEGVSPTYVPFRNGLLLSAASSVIAGEVERYRARLYAKRGLPLDPREHHPDSSDSRHADEIDASVGEWALYFGAHAEDAQNWAYPDCTPEFIGAMANAIYVGTYRNLRLHTPLAWLDKRRIIELGQSLGVDWSLTWSCYSGGNLHCGTCPTCRARRAGFEAAAVPDPTVYAE